MTVAVNGQAMRAHGYTSQHFGSTRRVWTFRQRFDQDSGQEWSGKRGKHGRKSLFLELENASFLGISRGSVLLVRRHKLRAILGHFGPTLFADAVYDNAASLPLADALVNFRVQGSVRI
jgi:hypothetical protein